MTKPQAAELLLRASRDPGLLQDPTVLDGIVELAREAFKRSSVYLRPGIEPDEIIGSTFFRICYILHDIDAESIESEPIRWVGWVVFNVIREANRARMRELRNEIPLDDLLEQAQRDCSRELRATTSTPGSVESDRRIEMIRLEMIRTELMYRVAKPKEKMVLELVARGSRAEAAETLGIKRNTVDQVIRRHGNRCKTELQRELADGIDPAFRRLRDRLGRGGLLALVADRYSVEELQPVFED